MAHHIQTDEGAGEDDELKQWIVQNKLSSAQQSLIENQVNLAELAELDPNDAKEYAKDVLGLNAIESIRFVKAVKLLSDSRNISTHSVPKQMVRVILTEQEDQAINKILNKKQEINKYINNKLNDINTLKKTAKSNENEINNLKKEFMNQLNSSMDKLTEKSNQEINKKNDILSNHVDALKTYVKNLNDANSQIDTLLNDPNIDKLKRKTKIINISNDALNINIDHVDVTPKVEVEINKNKVMDFINKMGTINNYNFPDKPQISTSHITSSSATVQFNNMKSSYQCVVELSKNYQMDNNDEDDEKKTNWKQICSIKNKDSYNITNLESNTSHAVRVRYKDQGGFGPFCSLVLFVTKKMEIESSILTSSEISTFLSLLSNNGKTLGAKTWKLIYRGKRDGINKQMFMSKCYGVSNIVVMIHNSTNNVFGGYSSTGWKKPSSGSYTKDDKSFLFSIRSSKNWAPAIANIKPDKAIYAMQWDGSENPSNPYCMWGNGTDVWIHGKENTVRVNNANAFQSFPQNNNYMSGGTYNTNINDIEVFQLLDT